MWRDTRITELTGARLPIVLAPMAGGPTRPQLVAEVCNAGGFGVLDAGYRPVDDLRAALDAVRRLTDRPFGVNVFVPQRVDADPAQVAATIELLRPYADELGIEIAPPAAPEPGAADRLLDGQVDAAVESGVRFVSFTFGLLPAERIAELRRAGVVTCGTATSVAEARAVAATGADAVCLQGAEAGGHRGGFLDDPARSLVGLTALVPLAREAVDLPLIAAGGIMSGRGVAAALTLGADAAQLGTAFLRCPEAGTSAPYRAALATAAETDTVITTALSGKPARGIGNRITAELAGRELPPYPVMNALTRELRKAAAAAGRSDVLSLWAGHGVAAGRELPAGELVRRLEQETDAAFAAIE